MARTIKEILDELLAHPVGDVLKDLPRGEGTLYQKVFNLGRTEGEKTANTAKATAEAEVTRLTAEVERTQGELDKAVAKAPDAAALVAQHQAAVAQLKKEHKDALAARDAALVTERVSNTQAQLEALLLRGDAENGVDRVATPAAARVLARDPDVAKRLRAAADSADVVVLGKDMQPLQGSDKATPLVLLAKELADSLDPGLRASGADGGNGTQPGAGGAGHRGAGGKEFYEGIRKGVQQDEQRSAPQGPSLEQRLGMAGVAPAAAA